MDTPEGRVNKKTSVHETRRDQITADNKQQLTYSQFGRPGANKVILHH